MLPAFVIQHFAGKVKYQIKVEKGQGEQPISLHCQSKGHHTANCPPSNPFFILSSSSPCVPLPLHLLPLLLPPYLSSSSLHPCVSLPSQPLSLVISSHSLSLPLLFPSSPYHDQDFRKKNTDHMRPDIVALLRSSERAFMRQLIGSDPVAVFRWGILRATIRIIAAFKEAGSRRAIPGRLHFRYPLS